MRRRFKVQGSVNRGFSPDDSLDESFTDVAETCEGVFRRRVSSEECEFLACSSRAESPELELYVPCEEDTGISVDGAGDASPSRIQIHVDSPLVIAMFVMFVSVLLVIVIVQRLVARYHYHQGIIIGTSEL